MTRRRVLLMAILWIAGFAEAKNLHWKDLPHYLDKKQVTVTDAQGTAHTGWFSSASGDALMIGIDGGAWTEIPRRSILTITVHRTRVNHCDRFGEHMFNFALTPFAIVTVPVAILVCIGGAPICALLDHIDRHRAKEITVKLLPDPK